MNEILDHTINIGHHSVDVLQLLESLMVLVLAPVGLAMLRRASKRGPRIQGFDEGKRFILDRLLALTVWTVAVLWVLSILGVELTALWAGSAALLVGVGIGLQGFFNDVVSGFVLLFEGGVQVGNVLEVEGELVKVERIDLRTTRVTTVTGEWVILPNAKVAGDSVVNMSLGGKPVRVHVDVGVAYGTEVPLVERLLLEAMAEQKEVLSKPAPQVFFQDFGDSSLDFRVSGWLKDPWNRMAILSNVRKAIDAKFRAEGVVVPFPQRDVHLRREA